DRFALAHRQTHSLQRRLCRLFKRLKIRAKSIPGRRIELLQLVDHDSSWPSGLWHLVLIACPVWKHNRPWPVRQIETVANRMSEKLQFLRRVLSAADRPNLFRVDTCQCTGKALLIAMISFAERVTVPSNVLIRFLDQESVLLNLNTER